MPVSDMGVDLEVGSFMIEIFKIQDTDLGIDTGATIRLKIIHVY